MNHCWMSAIIFSEKSVENRQVFWPWSSFKMSAWTVPRTERSTSRRIPATSPSSRARPSAAAFSQAWSMAVLKNIARIAGAGPLIVIDTDVVGDTRSKPA